METLISEAPAIPQEPVKFRFTSANAAAMARRSAESKKRKLETPIQTRARIIALRIDSMLEELALAEPKDAQALATSIEKLNKTWMDLTGHERAGVRKPGKGQKASDPFAAQLPPIGK